MARPGGDATRDLVAEKATSSRSSCRHDESLMSMRTRVCYTTSMDLYSIFARLYLHHAALFLGSCFPRGRLWPCIHRRPLIPGVAWRGLLLHNPTTQHASLEASVSV